MENGRQIVENQRVELDVERQNLAVLRKDLVWRNAVLDKREETGSGKC